MKLEEPLGVGHRLLVVLRVGREPDSQDDARVRDRVSVITIDDDPEHRGASLQTDQDVILARLDGGEHGFREFPRRRAESVEALPEPGQREVSALVGAALGQRFREVLSAFPGMDPTTHLLLDPYARTRDRPAVRAENPAGDDERLLEDNIDDGGVFLEREDALPAWMRRMTRRESVLARDEPVEYEPGILVGPRRPDRLRLGVGHSDYDRVDSMPDGCRARALPRNRGQVDRGIRK